MTIISPLPNTFVNGTTIDATQVNANFSQVVANVNANAAASGANDDITSLSALTTPIPPTAGGVPTGALFDFAAVTPPSGYLACDGSAVSRTTYAALFAVLGTVWGAGDGSTTFNIPDYRGRVSAGYDASNATGRLTDSETGGANASAIGNTGGEQAHVLVTGELAAHNHGITDPEHSHGITDPEHSHPAAIGAFLVASPGSNSVGSGSEVSTNATTGNNDTGITINSAATGITVNNAGSGTAHNNVQPVAIALKIIKT